MILWMSVALAQDAVTFEAKSKVSDGETASVTFHSRVDGSLRVNLDCGVRRYELSTAIAPGSRHELPLEGLPQGQFDCGGTVRLDQPDGSWGEMPLTVPVAVLSPLTWTYGMEDVDLKVGSLTVHPSRPLSEATVTLIGPGGAVLGQETANLSDPSTPTFSWAPPASGEVLKLRVEGADQAGIAGFLELSPWSYAVPHDDVVFPSGSHRIEGAEEPKLEACWAEVETVLAKYGDVVDIELFVAGYTDTVGDAASNRGLSERRARAIAAWFRQRGFRGPVWFQGFGESVLAVGTPDETDEPANRRALYVLAADKPPVSDVLPQQAWTKL